MIRQKRSLATIDLSGSRAIWIVLGCVALVITIVLGFKNGWLDLQGRPIQHIRELQVPVDERNRQIDDLVKPSPTSTRGNS